MYIMYTCTYVRVNIQKCTHAHSRAKEQTRASIHASATNQAANAAVRVMHLHGDGMSVVASMDIPGHTMLPIDFWVLKVSRIYPLTESFKHHSFESRSPHKGVAAPFSHRPRQCRHLWLEVLA